jgi:hypothetical protein
MDKVQNKPNSSVLEYELSFSRYVPRGGMKHRKKESNRGKGRKNEINKDK